MIRPCLWQCRSQVATLGRCEIVRSSFRRLYYCVARVVHPILGSGDGSYSGVLYHLSGNGSFPNVQGESRFAPRGIRVGKSGFVKVRLKCFA